MSADVLARKLEDTHAEIAQVRAEVAAALRTLYAADGNGAAGVSLDDALRLAGKWAAPDAELPARVRLLEDALLAAVAQLQPGGAAAPARLVRSFTQRERLKRQAAQAAAMLSLVDKLTRADRLLGDINGLLDERQLVAAAHAVQEAQQLLAALTAEDAASETPPAVAAAVAGVGAGDSITKLMELQILRKKHQLLLKLKQIYATTLVWKDGALRVSKMRADTGGVLSAGGSLPSGAEEQLSDFWAACEIMGVLPERMKDLAKALAQHLIKPALQGASAATKVARDASSATIKLVRDDSTGASPSSKKSEVAQVEEKCASVVSILCFLHAEVFQSSAELMGHLGEFLWKIPGNLEMQLMALLQEKIPQDAAALGSYRDALAVGVRELEEKLRTIGFSACVDSQLHTFVQQLQELYAKKRRQSILSQARDTMRRGYNDSTKITGATERCNLEASVGSGKKKDKSGTASSAATSLNGGAADVEGGAFQVPNYRVSTCAHDIVELAHQTLIEGCTSEPKCANLLFQTSRDLLFLFRAVVPTLYESDIANDPRTCMLYHNDCLYIAYHMLTIGHQYKHRLPAPLNRTGTMVDMVPAFREAGEKALVTYAKGQTDELTLGLAMLPAFGDADSDQAMTRIEEFIKNALYKLNRISSFWREGLPPAVYSKIMGLMVSPFVSGFVERVFAAPKISAIAGTQLHHLTSMLLECEHLFDSPGQADKHVLAILKLRKLMALLTEPLAKIRDQFHAGDLSMFGKAELAQLVRSLHRDSHEKKEFLSVLH